MCDVTKMRRKGIMKEEVGRETPQKGIMREEVGRETPQKVMDNIRIIMTSYMKLFPFPFGF